MHLLSRSWLTVVRKSQGGLRAGVLHCLLALCALQAAMAVLGQMHQIAHGPLPPAALAAGDDDAPVADQAWLGTHTAGDCQLFHHHALGLGEPVLVNALLASSYAPLRNARLAAVLLRQSPALFFARGPPHLL